MNSTDPAATMAADLTDADLIRASLSDPQAFGSLFDRHVDVIYGYITRRVGTLLAEELTAETFARAFARRGSFVGLPTRDKVSAAPEEAWSTHGPFTSKRLARSVAMGASGVRNARPRHRIGSCQCQAGRYPRGQP